MAENNNVNHGTVSTGTISVSKEKSKTKKKPKMASLRKIVAAAVSSSTTTTSSSSSTSSAAVKKCLIDYVLHKAGSPIRSVQKQIILNIYCKLQEEHPGRTQEEISLLTEKLTGVSRHTIWKIMKENRRGKLVKCGITRPLAKGTRTRMKQLDEIHKEGIRRHVHDFFFRSEIPSTKDIMNKVNNDPTLPNFSMGTMYRTLRDLGFRSLRAKRQSILLERDWLTIWRRRYLRKVRHFRDNGRTIYYVDETCFDSGAGDEEGSTTKQTSNGNGTRFVVAHIGSSNGFVSDGLLKFRAKKSVGDYQQQINETKFETWFEEVLKKLDPNSVIVLDDAPYHLAKTEPIPVKGWSKEQIQDWLKSKEIQFTPCMIVSELLDLVNGVKHRYSSYKIDKLAQDAGHIVLRLPPNHGELNAIEMVWTQIKQYVACNVHTFEPTEVERLIHEGIAAVTCDNWRSHMDRVKCNEQKLWDLDIVTDTLVQEFDFSSDQSDNESSDSSNSVLQVEDSCNSYDVFAFEPLPESYQVISPFT